MRHRKTGRQLGRNSAHRKSLYRNLVTALLEHERIETTLAKAKEVRGIAEKLVTLGKRGDLHARRQVASYVRSPAVVKQLFDRIALRVADRPGGYFRIFRHGFRHGDAAPLAIIELVDREVETAETKGSADSKTASKKSRAKKEKGKEK